MNTSKIEPLMLHASAEEYKMSTLPYNDLPFFSDREKARFEDWLTRTPFSPYADSLYIRREQISWMDVLRLFREFRQRQREGWYCSFEDSYGEAVYFMRGENFPDEGSLDEQLERAKELFHTDIRLAVSKIIQLAKVRGHPEAMFLAAEFHLHGLYAKQNDELAAYYAREAASFGFAGAYGLLAMLYLNGIGVEPDEDLGEHYRDLACQYGYACCHKYLGILHLQGEEDARDPHAGREHLLKAAKMGDWEAAFLLGYCNVHSILSEDVEHDLQVLQEAASLHNPASMYLIGFLLIQLGALDCSFRGISDGMGYMVEAGNAGWPEAVSYLEAPCEFIELNDGNAVERGDFYDILYTEGAPYRSQYRLVPSAELEKAEPSA